jgi:hypothetical protein
LIALIVGFLTVALAVACWLVSRGWARRRLADKLDGAIHRHVATLIRVRAETIRRDANGRLDSPEWRQEIERFLDSQFSSLLTGRELRGLEARRQDFAGLAAKRVAAGAAQLPFYQ